MINHLKLFKYKGITECILNDLGQINVICGKNSSGKSSILESIIDPEKHSIGTQPNPEEINNIFRGVAQNRNREIVEGVTEWISKFSTDYFSRNPILFGETNTDFISELIESQKLNPIFGVAGKYGYQPFNLADKLNDYFKIKSEAFKPVLIPPKRTLKSQTSIELNEPLQSNGNGTVNHLFYLKNQDLQSQKYITYRRIYDTFNEITGYSFNIIPDKENKLKLIFRVDKTWQDADDCGLGLRDLLIIITFILATDHNFYLIEEPENHLHADFQKRLLNFIRNTKGKQFLLSTHSNTFLDLNNVDKIFYCWFDKEVFISDETSLSKIVSALGYSVTENITSDAIILTEGPKDIPVIQKVLQWVGALDKYNIKLWPLGGDIMAELDLSIFSERKTFAIIDSGPGSKKIRDKFKKNCKAAGITCFILERYATENYFTLDAIRKVFPDQIPARITELDPNSPVDVQIGFKTSTKDKTIKGKNVEIIENMRMKDLEGTDLLVNAFKIKSSIDKLKEVNQED